MRLKCVKGAKEKVDNSLYLIKEKQDIFDNKKPLYIEIGMGKGNFIIENAKRYKDINFIGIEKYDSVIVRAVEKLENIELPNLKLLRMDAEKIEEMFDKNVDLIYLNFSDPWPKSRHEKRRLSSEYFLKKYDNIFKNTKHIIMKTDNRKLFEFSIKSFTDFGYKINNISLNLYNDEIPNNIPTEYEEKFNKNGDTIYMIDVEK